MTSSDNSLTPKEIMDITCHGYFDKVERELVGILARSRSKLSPVDLINLQLEIANKVVWLEKHISYFASKADRLSHNSEWLTREIYRAHRRVLNKLLTELPGGILNF